MAHSCGTRWPPRSRVSCFGSVEVLNGRGLPHHTNDGTGLGSGGFGLVRSRRIFRLRAIIGRNSHDAQSRPSLRRRVGPFRPLGLLAAKRFGLEGLDPLREPILIGLKAPDLRAELVEATIGRILAVATGEKTK